MIKNGIYGYYDKKNHQIVYIGQSKDIFARHYQHMKPSHYNKQSINRILQNNKHRYKLVIIKVRSTFSKEDRDILEKHYIEFYNTFFDDNKFNYTPGGDFAPSTVPEIAKKISKANSGKHLTEERIEKIRKAKIGIKQSDETQKKISLSKGNSTGYRRVSLQVCPTCKSGKTYKYRCFKDDGKRISISSANLQKLKEKVIERGLPWEKIN